MQQSQSSMLPVPPQLPEQMFKHSNNKNEYTVYLSQNGEYLFVRLMEKFTLAQWKCNVKRETLAEITKKTGYEITGAKFIEVLRKALSQREIDCYVDILTAQDLQNLKNKKSGLQKKPSNTSSSSPGKRYLILTYMTNQSKYHYPLSLGPTKLQPPLEKLKQLYNQLRTQLEAARASALNDTQKSQSFSINYNNEKDKSRANKGLNATNKIKEIDQVKSENQILKAKLARLEEQVDKKKANIQIQAAIQRIKLLKQSIETANLQLVDWKNNIQDQQQTHLDLKKQLAQLHKKICSMLQSQKQSAARKKGQQIQKQLNQTKTVIKKNTTELDRLRKQLQSSKTRVKQLQIKAKKLNSQKQVIRKGKRGPYSSAGSVRSYGSYNSYNSAGKRSTGGNSMASRSSGKSGYSYNSYSYGRR